MFAKLIMVTAMNNNKFYVMQSNDDNTSFTATYGRVGNAGQTATYPMSKWSQKYNEKIKKGYKDVTGLVETAKTGDTVAEFKPISDKGIAEAIGFLSDVSRQILKRNYSVSLDAVTEEMVNEAQYILNRLSAQRDVFEFNNVLLQLFQALPRQMGQVKDHMMSHYSEKAEIIAREQDLLDVMRGQVIHPNAKAIKKTKNDQTILDAMGIMMRPVREKEEAEIKNHLGQQACHYKRAWRVINTKTQDAFNQYLKDHTASKRKMFWHGSRNENWLNILKTGLVLNPNAVATGKMFGMGIYFAPSASKSVGYTSLAGSYWAGGTSNRAFMGVMDVACGKSFDIYDNPYGWSDLTAKKLEQKCPGANYVFAHKDKGMLRNDELIVYNEAQVTIHYLVELSN